MSLDKAAKYLESHGRGDDTMLVHMTPGEVKGLQDVAMAHGGSLSINPNTGLVEAGWLKNLLPMIAGAAVTAATGGAAAPWMVGLGYGAFETARTGDLSKGLLAGLGAYGGAGLGSAAGLGASTTPAASGAGTGISTAGGAGAGTAVTPTASGGLGAAPSSVGLNPAATGGASGITPSAGSLYTPNMAPAASPFNMANAKYAMSAAAPVIADASQPKVPDPYSGPLGNYELSENYKPFDIADWRRRNVFAEGGQVQNQGPQTDFFPQAQFNPSQYATPTQRPASREVINADFDAPVNPYNGNPTMFAEGGKAKAKATPERTIAAMDPYQATLARLNNARHNANMSQFDMPKTDVAGLGAIPYVVTAAEGGHLGGYSDGGRMLKGPGDGMSDSIPASISGKQPARLADGEFVVPADVVSHLGNGSTDAGAKRLYSMMDKVRHARTGTKKQGKEIKADKYLPS